MSFRQITDRQREWLARELDHWTSQGILQPAQAEQIRGCYETTAESGQRKQSVARFALQGLAALLVGLAVLLVTGYNWQAIPWPSRLGLIFGGLVGLHGLGYYLRFYRSARRSSELAFFAGCLLFGAAIWLIAEIFQLDSHAPDGVWWWAVAVLPFALVLDTLLLHLLLVGLLALWAGMEVIGYSHLGPWWLWHWWPNSALSLPLVALPGLAWAYRRGSAVAVGLYVPLLAWWILLQAIAWDLEWQSVYIVGTLGAMLLIVAENHRHGSRLAAPYRVYGMLLVGGALVPLSFVEFQRDAHRWAGYGRHGVQSFAELVQMLVLVAAMLAFTFLLHPLGPPAAAHPLARLGEVLRRQWVPFGLVLVMSALALWNYAADHESAWLAAGLANVAMIVLAIWLMQVGLREERGRLFTAGVLYFLLWTLLRYAEFFGSEGGMLGAALMFFLCGAALFGLAMFWGRRKEARHVA